MEQNSVINTISSITAVMEAELLRTGHGKDQASFSQKAHPDAFTWYKCPKCSTLHYHKDVKRNLKVCPECHYHDRLRWFERLDSLLDENSFVELNRHLASPDPLQFRTTTERYLEKLQDVQRKTGLRDALITGCGKLHGHPVAIAVTDFAFLGASMGTAFGEKFVRLVDFAIEYRMPLLTISSSGGARMHEGLFSLMQMAKITVALARLGKAGIPHLAVLTDPCYGGVTASYAMAADVILAEKGAKIGFTGARVIEQTTRQVLPSGFQTAEFLFEHGMIDQVVERRDLPLTLIRMLQILAGGIKPRPPIQDYQAPCEQTNVGAVGEPLVVNSQGLKTELTVEQVWNKVQLARHPERPQTLDYLAQLCDDFIELHGDRCYGDDGALIGSIATFAGRPVMIIGHQKGHNTKENIKRNFGMAQPEGYRKALRLFQLAEKLAMPVLTFIDTSGAYPGLEGEERGVARAISENLSVMADLQVPIISVVLGEGGSGGALGIGLSDRILMLENAIYSVASPEASASILWHDATLAPQAARAMRITAQELHALGLIDEIIPEAGGGAHTDLAGSAQLLKDALLKHLMQLEQEQRDGHALVERRYGKFRAIGCWDGVN